VPEGTIHRPIEKLKGCHEDEEHPTGAEHGVGCLERLDILSNVLEYIDTHDRIERGDEVPAELPLWSPS
jgi:hypothetical protein